MTQKLFARIVKFGGTALITIFAIMFVLGFITGETDLMSELYKKIGTMAEIAAIAAFALWVIRLAF
ncbi:MAG: hypothetical protein WB217_00145, partial [Mesobacillus sp.]|uniref:hypothetical protein n=1 Tax=Mesobacillus sp. TaxID=2675271 RepID=UPI003C6101E2